MIILIFLAISVLIGILFYLSNKLWNKNIKKESDERFNPLIMELKEIDKMAFKTVSSELMYSHCLSVFFKALGYLLTFPAVALLLDFLTIKHFIIHNYGDFAVSALFYLVGSFIVFVYPLLSCAWDFLYFKYGLSHQLKHADIAFDYISTLPAKILKKYPPVFIVSYILGRTIFGIGFIGVLIGTVIYQLSISIYFTLEVKRIGFAPVFNLFTEKLNEFKGGKNAKHKFK